MTPAEFRAIRDAFGLSAEGCARFLRVQSGRTVRRWEAGDSDIPGAVQLIMELARDVPAVRIHLGLQARST